MNKLQTIIEYAIANGWKCETDEFADDQDMYDWARNCMARGFPFEVIYSHDFLKAVFGELQLNARKGEKFNWGWEYHAKQMVVKKDPVSYVYKYVKENSNGS